MGKFVFFVDVQFVVGQFLSDEYQFFDVKMGKVFGFFYQCFDRLGYVFVMYQGDGIKSIGLVVVFGYFQVSIVLGCGGDVFFDQFMFVVGIQFSQQAGQFQGVKVGVYFGDFLFQVVFVVLRKVIGNIEFVNVVLFFDFCIIQNGIDGFFFGQVDEVVGIYDDYVSIFVIVVVYYFVVIVL